MLSRLAEQICTVSLMSLNRSQIPHEMLRTEPGARYSRIVKRIRHGQRKQAVAPNLC